MGEIRDFHCTYDNSAGISKDVTANLNLEFPDAYLHWDTMAVLSEAIREKEQAAFCELPFCHTVEAEAMGGIVNYGNNVTGPRAKEYITTDPEKLPELPPIDFAKGRMHEVLLACKTLKEQGRHVALEVSGPFTILNVLIDARYVFKAMRKKPELMKEVFWKLGGEILRLIEVAQDYGVEMISYADSCGSVKILGPKMAEQVVEDFTYEFVKEAVKRIHDDAILLLCPKTALALIGTEHAVFEELPLSGPMRYGEACIEMIGQTKLGGQMCIKNVNYELKNAAFKAVKLL